MPYQIRDMESLPYYAEAAARAARASGALLMRHLGRHGKVETKRSAIDLVTKVDRAAEHLIRRLLARADPRIGFLGEEYGPRNRAAPCRWIVDPLDGTNNFVHGLPIFGVSIALQAERDMLVGVIYDPVRRELFTATRGGGAFLNGRRIRVSATRALSRSLLSTGFSSKFLTRSEPYLGWFRTLQRHSHGVRRIGSTVWCLAAVAAGRLEGFYERDLWPWDMAAGMRLVTEAGGTVTDLDGRPPALGRGRLVATNGRIHDDLLRLLRRSGR
ncbi:MAG: inositol monophosphatase [Candidatus Omnitrophica bacterium]|nr:inositol monophosphatase [Candidatus Omnitrophota bacterium]